MLPARIRFQPPPSCWPAASSRASSAIACSRSCSACSASSSARWRRARCSARRTRRRWCIAAIVGGIAGAALLLAAYFVGVALVGAGIGALLVNVIWTQIEGDPHPAVVILFSVAGAVVATWLQRYVIILGTAFAGAWTMLVGGAGGDGRQRSADARPRPATCGSRIRSIPRRACDGCRGRGSRSARSARWCRCAGPAAIADASARLPRRTRRSAEGRVGNDG